MKTKYYIDYHYEKNNGILEAYWMLIRTIDDAILYSNEVLDNIKVFCFEVGISSKDVTIL